MIIECTKQGSRRIGMCIGMYLYDDLYKSPLPPEKRKFKVIAFRDACRAAEAELDFAVVNGGIRAQCAKVYYHQPSFRC
jgi:hypothetical protein